MKRHWESFRIRIEALAVRERAMILAAAAVTLIFLSYAMLIDPLSARQKAGSAELAQQQLKIRELQVAIDAMRQARAEDLHSPLRARIRELDKQLKDSDGFIRTRSEHLVDPRRIGQLLEKMLRSGDRLQLVEFKTLPVGLLIEQTGSADQKPQAKIYRHGVQITVRGSYQALQDYLVALEKTKVFWADLSLSAPKHQDATMTLTVYTLSLDKAWLKV